MFRKLLTIAGLIATASTKPENNTISSLCTDIDTPNKICFQLACIESIIENNTMITNSTCTSEVQTYWVEDAIRQQEYDASLNRSLYQQELPLLTEPKTTATAYICQKITSNNQVIQRRFELLGNSRNQSELTNTENNWLKQVEIYSISVLEEIFFGLLYCPPLRPSRAPKPRNGGSQPTHIINPVGIVAISMPFILAFIILPFGLYVVDPLLRRCQNYRNRTVNSDNSSTTTPIGNEITNPLATTPIRDEITNLLANDRQSRVERASGLELTYLGAHV